MNSNRTTKVKKQKTKIKIPNMNKKYSRVITLKILFEFEICILFLCASAEKLPKISHDNYRIA